VVPFHLQHLVLPDEGVLERRKVRIRVGTSGGYALGLAVGDTGGLTVLSHGGGTRGFSSQMYTVPALGVGIIILTNKRPADDLVAVVTRKVIGLLFDGTRTKAAGLLTFLADRQHKTIEDARAGLEKAVEPAWLQRLAGVYRHDRLGEIEVKVVDGRSHVDAGGWSARAARRREADGAVKLVMLDPPLPGLEFIVLEGDPPTLVYRDQQVEYVLKRVPRP
jgi:hypothetical protein